MQFSTTHGSLERADQDQLKKHTSTVARVKDESNRSFRSCSVSSTAREEETVKSSILLCLIIPAARLLSSDNTHSLPLQHWKASYDLFSRQDESWDYTRGGEDRTDRERLGRLPRHSGSDSSSGLQVSTQVGLHQACIIQPTSVTGSFLTSGRMSLICSLCSSHDPARRDNRTPWPAAR